MKLVDIPYKFQYVWGENADSGFVTDPIPATTTAPAASQSLGFPPETSEPIAAGGTPPNINDFNGAYQYVTLWLRWLQAGVPVPYDATFQANIGGYPKTILVNSVAYPGVVWQSTADDNTTNPDAAGAGWQQYPPHGEQTSNVSFTFTFPVGVTRVHVELWGAGGSGGNTSATGINTLGGPGGGGAYTEGWLKGVPGQNLSVTVGLGGIADVRNGGASSVSDGTTSLVAGGGTNGGDQAGGGIGSAGAPGTASGGTFNQSGFIGPLGYVIISGTAVVGSSGGASWKCGTNIASSSTGSAFAGIAGQFPGQAGSGGIGGGAGGGGANGLAIFKW